VRKIHRGGVAEKIKDSNSYKKNSAGVASLRGQGTPAYPARLRSERARNSSRILPAAGQKGVQELLLAQDRESDTSSACGFFGRREISGGREPGSGGLPFPEPSTYLRRREGIRSAQWPQPRRRRLLREARCAARGRGSGRVPVRPE